MKWNVAVHSQEEIWSGFSNIVLTNNMLTQKSLVRNVMARKMLMPNICERAPVTSRVRGYNVEAKEFSQRSRHKQRVPNPLTIRIL